MSLQQELNQLKLVLDKAQSIAIVVPENATFDQLAAALGLYLGLLKLGKSVSVLASSKPKQGDNLVGIEKIKTSLDGANLVISFPYDEGSIEKVSYTEELGRLNIVIEPTDKQLKFSKEDVRFNSGGNNVDVVFTVGVSKLEDIGELYVSQSALFSSANIINIGNGQEVSSYGKVNIVNPKLPTVSEIIALVLKNLNVVMDKDIATNLYRGLQHATDDFASDKVSALTFEAAALTMRSGAVRMQIQPAKQVADPVGTAGPVRIADPVRKEVEEAVLVETLSPAPVKQTEPATIANDWLKPKIFSTDKN
ncbi:hypothetical protein COW99_01050 [Candidatus Roizmanbacteria bacterium CG22_combo_CG10-13_8_21_14_all_38_20]|uniref:DDH domain-containing protein n=1 Tax=Candidatus Roizmanbacteria bacterium CG22_combo_CG10-13_8_21_14_all_38_20 TaxID=1974862 RepID=A0A2H0BWP1_9BACT|nr:hypothetical protein [Candidatus Microgenomates bacterium]PIP61969.1 MAG: hypothetical protein COW99_01050 [Candidatus Roizmanbacteria bacterium CG22_combo_CG10-13_8_21_14_all_38_20]PJC31907.1 MAG: hypothetical protein CO050_01705 [Candidatus Roizmanbacteria bacterium CG_4_9_14_0_2_um_filter_38_17]